MLFGGLLAVLLVVFVATAGVPLPAELAIVYGGYLVSSGDASAWVVVLVAWLGSIAGAGCLYLLARHAGRPGFTRYGRRMGLSRRHLRRAEDWFDRGGFRTVALARLVPGLRTVISVPAGIAKMSFARFLAATAIGLLVQTVVLVAIGFALGDRWREAGSWTTIVIVVVMVLGVLASVVAWWRAQREDDDA